jgi:hypothetical protein
MYGLAAARSAERGLLRCARAAEPGFRLQMQARVAGVSRSGLGIASAPEFSSLETSFSSLEKGRPREGRSSMSVLPARPDGSMRPMSGRGYLGGVCHQLDAVLGEDPPLHLPCTEITSVGPETASQRSEERADTSSQCSERRQSNAASADVAECFYAASCIA